MAASPWSPVSRAMFGLIVVVWGLNYLFVRLGLDYASPLWLATLRAGIGAAAALAIVVLTRADRTLDRRDRRDALLLGIPNTALFFGLWFYAAGAVLPGTTAVVIYSFPLWVALFSPAVLGHRILPTQWAAVGLGFLGVAVLSEPWTSVAGGVGPLPFTLLLAAAVSWAVGTVLFQRRFSRPQMLEASAFQMVGGAGALLAATLLVSPSPLPSWTPVSVATVVWLGVLGTAIAYALWFTLLGRIRAARLSGYLFLVPVVSLAASAVAFGERLSAVQFVGVALVFGSIYLIGRATDSGSDRSAALGTSQ